MTTEDRAYEAAARVLVGHNGQNFFDLLTPELQAEVTAHAKQIVDTFLTAMGQEVR